MENNEVIELLKIEHPKEYAVAEAAAKILQQLELIGEMEPYLQVYRMIHEEALEGRRLKEALGIEAEKRHIRLSEKPFKIWMTYEEYAFMKKKWKSFLRQKSLSEPSWKDCFNDIKTFLTPLWTALCDDEMFFLDWMPDLQRYFD